MNRQPDGTEETPTRQNSVVPSEPAKGETDGQTANDCDSTSERNDELSGTVEATLPNGASVEIYRHTHADGRLRIAFELSNETNWAINPNAVASLHGEEGPLLEYRKVDPLIRLLPGQRASFEIAFENVPADATEWRLTIKPHQLKQ